jgi:hypothetical protein
LIAQGDWEVGECFDRNHVVRSVFNLWGAYALLPVRDRKRRRRVLGEWIKRSMFKHFHYVCQ